MCLLGCRRSISECRLKPFLQHRKLRNEFSGKAVDEIKKRILVQPVDTDKDGNIPRKGFRNYRSEAAPLGLRTAVEN